MTSVNQMAEIKKQLHSFLSDSVVKRNNRNSVKLIQRFISEINNHLQTINGNEDTLSSKTKLQISESVSHIFLEIQKASRSLPGIYKERKDQLKKASTGKNSDKVENVTVTSPLVSNISLFKKMIIEALSERNREMDTHSSNKIRNNLNIAVMELDNCLYSAGDNLDQTILTLFSRVDNLSRIISDVFFNNSELVENIILENKNILQSWLKSISNYIRKI